MDSPQQCVPTHCFLRLEPSIVQATSFHQQLPSWMCLPLTHPSSLFSLRRDFSPPPDFRTVRNCPEPLSMRRRTAFLRQGCRILYIVGVCVNRIGTEARSAPSADDPSPPSRRRGYSSASLQSSCCAPDFRAPCASNRRRTGTEPSDNARPPRRTTAASPDDRARTCPAVSRGGRVDPLFSNYRAMKT